MNGTSVEILNDQDVALSETQVVNVGEHVRVKLRVQPSGTTFTNPQWLVTGLHIQHWITKDAESVSMTVNDYLGDSTHFTWKDVTIPGKPNIVRVSALVGSTIVSAEVKFQVERQQKPEKFYSDDHLMENHNNWHTVHNFMFGSTRIAV